MRLTRVKVEDVFEDIRSARDGLQLKKQGTTLLAVPCLLHFRTNVLLCQEPTWKETTVKDENNLFSDQEKYKMGETPSRPKGFSMKSRFLRYSFQIYCAGINDLVLQSG